jgi:peptide/nickel transport system substrate-binding protein
VVAAFALLLGCLVPALALSTSGPANASDETSTFTVAIANEVDSFNPFVGIEAESFEMWALTYDYMITYSMEDMSPEPGLATEWEASDDGLTWTFTIRDDVTFSDGEPLTAEDIAYTYNRVLDGGPEAATWGSYLGQVTSITAPDPTTVVLELKKPNSSLPLLPIPIVPEHIWKDVPQDEVKNYKAEPQDGQPVVGSGPFRLVEGQAGGSTYRFEANPDYWQGAAHIDEVVFRVYKSEDPMIQALIKGEVDFAEGISALQVKSLEGRDGITAINGDSPGFDEIAFNTGAIDTETGEPMGDGNPALEDAAFRYALGFAIDRDVIVDRAYQGAGDPGGSIIPPLYGDYHWEAPDDVAFSYDPDRAAELLDEAGYTVGDDGFRTMPNGDPIGTLRLYARSDSPTSVDVMNFFQEWLADVDIDSEVSAKESSNLTELILEGDFDAFEWGWYVEPDPSSMLSYMTCGQLGNWSDSWYCNDEYDALYDQQQTETDPEARAEQVRQMQEILYMDAPYLVTAYSSIGEAFRSDRFACLRPQPDPGGIYLIQYGVYNYLNMRPADEAGDCGGVEGVTQASSSDGSDGGVSSGVLVGIGVAAAAVAVGAGVVMMRRRRTAGDRE